MSRVTTARFRIVTPMFLGNWEHKAEDGIRPPSVKGALRFWWRAMHWKNALEQSNYSENEALKWLHKEESRLFGSAAGDGGGGQGLFLLRVIQENLTTESPELNQGQRYLGGQGLCNNQLRKCFKRDQLFDIEIRFSRDAKQEDIKSIEKSVLLLGLLGGLGSRSRRGFGSLSIESFSATEFAIPKDEEEYKKILNNLIDVSAKGLPPFTAFSEKTRIDISARGKNGFALMDKIGKEMQMYRSYGQNRNGVHEVDSRDAEQNFKKDHDEMLNFSKKGKLSFVPKRSVFGMPHNYFFSSTGVKIEFFPKLDENDQSGRRASPLFVHIHKLPNEKYLAVQALICAQFLPQGARFYAKMRDRSDSKEAEVDWGVIHGYLNRFKYRVEIFK